MEGSPRTTRRRRLARGMAAAGGALAAGCAAPGAPRVEPGAPQAARQPATLRLNYRTEKGIPERAKEFEAAHPGITVDLVADSGYEKLIALTAAGDLGDVVWASAGIGTYYELAAPGAFRQLDAVVGRDKFDLRQYYPAAVEAARLDGKLYGLPEVIHPSHIGLYSNATLFESAGLKPPTLTSTVDDILEAARRLTGGSAPDGRPAQWGIQTETAYAPVVVVLRTFGGEFLDPPTMGKRPALDRGPAKQALQWLADLRHRHRVHPLPGVDKVSFVDGTLAMQTTGMWGATMARTVGDRFKMDATLLPKAPGGRRGSASHVGLFAMNAQTKHPDAAWLLLKWHTDKESALRQAALDSGIPGARPDAWNDPQILARPMYRVFKDYMESEVTGPYAIPWNFRALEVEQLTNRALAPLWTGEQGVDQVLATAVAQYQALLDQPRPRG